MKIALQNQYRTMKIHPKTPPRNLQAMKISLFIQIFNVTKDELSLTG